MSRLTSASFNGSARQIKLAINEMEPGKQSHLSFLNETVNGKTLPGHVLNLFLHNGKNGSRFFGISGPIRSIDDNGNYIMIPRVNSEGKFLSDRGEVVEDQSKAGLTYQYVKNQAGEVVFGSYGSLSVNNLKKDNTPTKSTYLTLSLMSDKDVLGAERLRYQAANSATPEQKAHYEAQLSEARKKGEYISLAIKGGADLLVKLGFEVRLPAQEPAREPGA